MRHACRILAILLFLAFGLGTPGYAMPSGEMSHQAMMSDAGHGKPEMSAGHHEMPDGDCGSCMDDVAMSACVSACLGVQAVLPDADATAGRIADAFEPLPQQRISGSVAGPDPFPPKLLA